MGFGGISIWQLLIILAIVLLLFGTKRLKNIGSDLGGAIKGFKKSMSEGEKEQAEADKEQLEQAAPEESGTVIDGEVKETDKQKEQN